MNSFSILHNYNQPLYTPDFDFIQQGLAFKQQKFDANQAKLQNIRDRISILNVSKEVDQNYIDNRLQEVQDINNRYASRDLSDDSFTNSLIDNMTQVLDDKVKNAVYSTKVIGFEDAQWEKMKQDKPELYAELNREYALKMSDRQRYFSSESAGDKYKGGAGFIEYRDLSKKLMENIPKLQDMLKAKWIETGPQQGYFQSQDTYEAIDRTKMSSALDSLFDEKDKQQLQINGWGTYKDVSDDLLRQDYNSFFNSQLNEASNRLKNLEVLKSDPKWKGREVELNQEIAIWQKKKDDSQNFTFDKVYQTYGREGVAQTLYNAKYKENILDTYSYKPRLIDRDIDQVQKASVEFGQKLREFDQKVKNDERDYQLKVSEFEYKIAKDEAALKASKSTESTRTLGDRNKLEPDEILKNEIQILNADEANAIKGMNSLLGGGSISPEDYKDLAIQFKNLGDIYSAGGSVIIRGREIPVTKDNLQTFINFKENVLEESESEIAIRKKTENAITAMTSNLRRSTQAFYAGRASDMNPTELPNFKWKFETDPKTKKIIRVPIGPNDNGHYYARLLNTPEDKLSPAQKLTLKAYTTYQVIGDDELGFSPELRDKMFKNLNRSLVDSGVPYRDVYKIASSRQDVEKALGFETQGFFGTDYKTYSTNFYKKLKDLGVVPVYTVDKNFRNQSGGYIPEKYAGDVEKLAGLYQEYTSDPRNQNTISSIRNLENKLRNNTEFVKPKSLGQDYYLSELTGGDLEYTDKSGKSRRSRSNTGIAKNTLTDIQTDLAKLSQQLKLPSQYNLFISEKDPSYTRLKNILMQQGKVGDEFKGQIEIQPSIKNGGYSNDVELIVRQTMTTKGMKSIVPVVATTSLDVLQQSGIKLQDMKRPVYSAEYGEDSKPIHIGQGQAAENKQNPIFLNLNNIRQEASQYNALPQVNNIVATYYNRGYLFSIEPINGQYYKVGRDKQGNILAKIPTGDTEYDSEDVTTIYDNSEALGAEIVQEIIRNEMRKADILGN